MIEQRRWSVAVLAGLLALLPVARAAAQPPVAEVIDAVAGTLDARVPAVLARIHGEDRQLLALRSYLRAGPGLAARWSWTAQQSDAFTHSPEYQRMLGAISQVRDAFAAANPGYELWVNPQIRNLDIQLDHWNDNASVATAASHLLAALHNWLAQPDIGALTGEALHRAAADYLMQWIPAPIPTLAAPGLSQHGQMRAVDFQIVRDGQVVAGPTAATIASAWDAQGWTGRLQAAVTRAATGFAGPLPAPREPWHYNYSPPLPAP